MASAKTVQKCPAAPEWRLLFEGVQVRALRVGAVDYDVRRVAANELLYPVNGRLLRKVYVGEKED